MITTARYYSWPGGSKIVAETYSTTFSCRYPFHGQEHSGLFAKIRRGHFSLPESLSSRAKCLIRCLLRKEPEDRLDTDEVLNHPWLTHQSSRERTKRQAQSSNPAGGGSCTGGYSESGDQKVPEFPAKKKMKTE